MSPTNPLSLQSLLAMTNRTFLPIQVKPGPAEVQPSVSCNGCIFWARFCRLVWRHQHLETSCDVYLFFLFLLNKHQTSGGWEVTYHPTQERSQPYCPLPRDGDLSPLSVHTGPLYHRNNDVIIISPFITTWKHRKWIYRIVGNQACLNYLRLKKHEEQSKYIGMCWGGDLISHDALQPSRHHIDCTLHGLGIITGNWKETIRYLYSLTYCSPPFHIVLTVIFLSLEIRSNDLMQATYIAGSRVVFWLMQTYYCLKPLKDSSILCSDSYFSMSTVLLVTPSQEESTASWHASKVN